MATLLKQGVEQVCLAECDWLGFDLDHTFVRYRLKELSVLVFEVLGRYLIDIKKYSPEILSRGFLEYFPYRGLTFDAKRGNFLILSSSGKILKASHGTKQLTEAEVKDIYHHVDLAATAASIMKTGKADGFHAMVTFFDMPVAVLIAHYVDLEDASGGAEKHYFRILVDLLAGFNHCFDPSNFASGKGGYFSRVIESPNTYLHPSSPALRAWVNSLRERGVKLFLLTNSHSDYSTFLLDHCYGESWRDVFDLVIVNGKKPDFFSKTGTSAAPFLQLEANHEVGPEAALASGGAVVGGNHGQLHTFLSLNSRVAADGESILGASLFC